MPRRLKNTASAKYSREYRAKASEEKKAVWREQARLRQRRFQEKKKLEKERQLDREVQEKKRRRAEINARYRAKKKLAKLANQVELPLTPNSKAKSIADTIERATPTTSGCLKARGIEKTRQRIADKAIVDAAAKGMKEKVVRKSLLPLLKTANKKAVSTTLNISRTHFYTKSRKGVNPRLSKQTMEAVIKFYTSHDVSSPSPNKTKSGRAIRVLKFILKDVYEMFKAAFPEHVISLSAFKGLRPRSQVKLMKSAAWVQCACGICENLESIVKAINSSIARKKLNTVEILSSKYSLAKASVCDIENPHCRHRECPTCSPDSIMPSLSEWIDSSSGDIIRFAKWFKPQKADGTPGKHLRKYEMEKSPIDLITELKTALHTYPAHIYNAKSQARSFKNCKSGLSAEDCIVIVDFAENYVVRQGVEEQSAYYCRESVTIHPMVLLFSTSSEVVRDSVVMITDDLLHDAAAVISFFHQLSHHMQNHYPHIKNIRVWSDGCAAQYKSRVPLYNVASFTPYRLTWNFFGSRHGKCEADGEAAVVKNFLDRIVRARGIVMNTAKDVYDLLNSSERAIHSGSSQRHMYYIPSITIKDYRQRAPQAKSVPAVKNIRRVHQVQSITHGFLIRSLSSCYCDGPCTHPLSHTSIDYSG